MSNKIPLRAKQKACDLANAESTIGAIYTPEDVGANTPLRALAKYIAETQAADEEEALKALAREIVAKICDKAGDLKTAQDYRDGKWDDYFKKPSTKLACALAGIKAGIKYEQERGE